MKLQLFLTTLLLAGITSKAQQLDTNFADNGIYLFDDFSVTVSSLTDFIITSDNKILGLATSGNEGHILKLNENGTYDTSFSTDGHFMYVDDNDVIPVGVGVNSNGDIVVLSNEFIGSKLAIVLNAFATDGAIDMDFGTDGRYQNNAGNDDSRFGRQIHITPVNDIIIAADYTAFNPSDPDRATALKVSESGTTIFAESFGDNTFWSASTLSGNDLYMSYWSAGSNTTANIDKLNINDQSNASLVSRNVGAGLQKFKKLDVVNTNIYASNLEDRSNQLFNLRKYDQNGSLDPTYGTSGVLELNSNTFETDNITNSSGETFWVSVNENNGKQLLVEKVLANGQVDTNFGTNGLFTITLADFIDENRIKVNLDTGQDYLYISGTTESAPLANDGFGFVTKIIIDEVLLDIVDFDISDQIVTYPNPTKGRIMFATSDDLMIHYVKISDINGKQIRAKDYKNNPVSLKELEADFSGFSKGLYHLEVKTSKGKLFKKILLE